MNKGIHLDLTDTWIVPGQMLKANLRRGLRYYILEKPRSHRPPRIRILQGCTGVNTLSNLYVRKHERISLGGIAQQLANSA